VSGLATNRVCLSGERSSGPSSKPVVSLYVHDMF
jgi:hypothetical protein